MPDPTIVFSWLERAAVFAERHIALSILALIVLLAFGTPEIGPAEKPWVRRRDGLVALMMRAVEAYAQRTHVFRGIEDEVRAFREQSEETEKRVGAVERVVDWQTQVLIAIASVLKIDPLALLRREKVDVSQAGVSAVSRDSSTNLIGKAHDQGVESPPSTH